MFDNLTLGDGAVPREAVQRAAAITGADVFIQALPQGMTRCWGAAYNSLPDSASCSPSPAPWCGTGRAVVGRGHCAVDSASEAAFRAALHAAVIGDGRVVLTVAHRLATAQDADRVLVMEAGQSVEEGSPEELIRRGGRFAALLELEAAGWDWQMDGRAIRP